MFQDGKRRGGGDHWTTVVLMGPCGPDEGYKALRSKTFWLIDPVPAIQFLCPISPLPPWTSGKVWPRCSGVRGWEYEGKREEVEQPGRPPSESSVLAFLSLLECL